MFSDDIIPPCKSTAHPPHTDKRKWMKVIQEGEEHVTWCCMRCSEIVGTAAIQVQVLPKGWQKARWANRMKEREKQELLAHGPGRLRVKE